MAGAKDLKSPTPFDADDVHERVSYRTKAPIQITSELLIAESGNPLQNPVVGPTVVLVEQLNVVLSHGERVPAPSLGNLTPSAFGDTGDTTFTKFLARRPRASGK